MWQMMNEVDGIRQEDYCEMYVCRIPIKITYLLINVPCTCRSRARTCAENTCTRHEENSRFHHFNVDVYEATGRRGRDESNVQWWRRAISTTYRRWSLRFSHFRLQVRRFPKVLHTLQPERHKTDEKRNRTSAGWMGGHALNHPGR